jgi:glyoxylase-like metal-dependent hydrolase (beta-lactamase superfamily II)
MTQITERVHSIPAVPKMYVAPYAPNVYFLFDGKDAALIDSGFGDEESVKIRMDFIREMEKGVRLRYIVLTHSHLDHSGGAGEIRRRTGAKVVCHRELQPTFSQAEEEVDPELPPEYEDLKKTVIEAMPDILMEDNDVLEVGNIPLRMIFTPGHQAGHLCILLDDDRLIFTGDHVSSIGTTAIPPPPWGDMGQYMESLRKLLGIEMGQLCPGHGPPIKESHKKVEELIAHRIDRENRILELIAGGRETPEAIVKSIYPELDTRLVKSAVGQVLAHAFKLKEEGRVSIEGTGKEAKLALL